MVEPCGDGTNSLVPPFPTVSPISQSEYETVRLYAFVGHGQHTYSFQGYKDSVSLMLDADNSGYETCSGRTYELLYVETESGVEQLLQTGPSTEFDFIEIEDENGSDHQVTIRYGTDDAGDIGTHTLKLHVFLTDYTAIWNTDVQIEVVFYQLIQEHIDNVKY